MSMTAPSAIPTASQTDMLWVAAPRAAPTPTPTAIHTPTFVCPRVRRNRQVDGSPRSSSAVARPDLTPRASLRRVRAKLKRPRNAGVTDATVIFSILDGYVGVPRILRRTGSGQRKRVKRVVITQSCIDQAQPRHAGVRFIASARFRSRGSNAISHKFSDRAMSRQCQAQHNCPMCTRLILRSRWLHSRKYDKRDGARGILNNVSAAGAVRD